MASQRPTERPPAARRHPVPPSLPLPPEDDAPRSPRQILFETWPGRLFIVSAGFKFLVALLRLAVEPPMPVQIVSSAATIGLVIAVGIFTWRLFFVMKRRLLWRVRRRLILSYIFIGFVPALLIVGFFLLGAVTLTWNVSAYLFKDGFDKVVGDVRLFAQAAAAEIGRTPERALDTLQRIQRNGGRQYPQLSMAFVPSRRDVPAAQAGRWSHVAPPVSEPVWMKPEGFGGTIALALTDAPGEGELVVRAWEHATGPGGQVGAIVADVPIDAEMLARIYEKSGVSGGTVGLVSQAQENVTPVVGALRQSRADTTGKISLFSQSVAFFDYTDWKTGQPRQAGITLQYRLRELYHRLTSVQSVTLGGMSMGDAFLFALIGIAALFLIIEFAALVMGLALARSITSAVHQLFMGTERVRQGDFTHRIDVHSNDQLGELAQSFNQMTGSIENLLQTAAEKKRLEEELRIARQIQMSLLPRGALDVPGLGITALCVPAREVGGDYYDFFPMSNHRLGVLIADVSGKGTSAALYMAELKGLVLSLSQIYDSPRQLLIAVNRIISDNLDSRSFITMTYAVLDLQRGAMTYARAGHTPLIHLSGPAAGTSEPRVLTPSGMVLGLRFDGAAEKFAELLEEDRILLQLGDVVVFYTDGITEAMNSESDLFGESRLSRIVAEHGHLDSGELRERILREIEAFVGAADQHDDMTMILLKIERAFAAAEPVAVGRQQATGSGQAAGRQP